MNASFKDNLTRNRKASKRIWQMH